MKHQKNSDVVVVGYNVYYAPDGCDESYVGFADTMDDAKAMVGSDGLPGSLYDSARAAGHCAGMTAPNKSREIEEAAIWLDECYCAVPVRHERCF